MEPKRTEDVREDSLEMNDALADANELDPFEINFLPQFKQGRGAEDPFINQYGVIIGDHEYVSEQSPLEQWTENTDPAMMAGDQWVHPFKDIGFHTTVNREYFEQGIQPQNGIFMHPDKNVAYEYRLTHDLAEKDAPIELTDNTD
jgi:hypothetical protein